MCRERPGPRCSNGGSKRFNKAKRHHDAVRERYLAAEERGHVPSRLSKQMSKARLRLSAAERVYDQTPDGQQRLRERIEATRLDIESRFGGVVPAAGTEARDQYNVSNRHREALTKRLEDGISGREGSYKDLSLVKGERSRLRRQALARGGEMGPNGHPLSQDMQAVYRGEAEGMRLRRWNKEDVTRAASWIEHGANPAYHRNANLRPFERARDDEGYMVELGAKVDGEEPFSKRVRLNTPDGQVVEGRHDVFLTKNEEGKYVVSLRSTVASSWEDASPIDVTKQDLGHILKERALISRADHKSVVGTFTSKAEAKRAVTRVKREFDYAGTTARMGRDALVTRVARRNSELQRRGIVIWHRFQNPAYAG